MDPLHAFLLLGQSVRRRQIARHLVGLSATMMPVIDDREHRAAAVEARPGLGRVGRPRRIGRVGRDATVVLPVRRGEMPAGGRRHLGMRESA
jgi:hypothetical protein